MKFKFSAFRMSRSGHLLIDADPVRTALNALVQSTDRLKLFNEEVRTKRPIIITSVTCHEYELLIMNLIL